MNVMESDVEYGEGGMHMRELETERLILRKFTVDDAPQMYRNYASDPEVTRYLTWVPHKDEDATRDYLKHVEEEYAKDDTYMWALVLKDTSEVIGSVSVVHMTAECNGCEIGYCLGRPWWHQGLMSEAVRVVTRYLISEGFGRVEAVHDTENVRSGRVMRNAGMQFEGIMRKSRSNNRGIVDCAIYSLIPEDLRNDPEVQGSSQDM